MLRAPGAAVPGNATFSRIAALFSGHYGIWDEALGPAANMDRQRHGMTALAPLATGRYVGECVL